MTDIALSGSIGDRGRSNKPWIADPSGRRVGAGRLEENAWPEGGA